MEVLPEGGFGFGITKLNRKLSGALRDCQFQLITRQATSTLSRDDQRRRAFEAADLFNDSFPLCIDPLIRYNKEEFIGAIQRKLGIPLDRLNAHIGSSIATNGNSIRLSVDAFGNNVAFCPWCFWRFISHYSQLYA